MRILRPTHASSLVSARAFDQAFEQHLGTYIDVVPTDISTWLDEILGDDGEARDLDLQAAAFLSLTAGFQFLCPSHEGILLTPLFARLRNHGNAPIRLLIVAHSPGVFGLEWTLLDGLLRPGDRIIAPTRSAATVIDYLNPALLRFVRVIPHPIQPLERRGAAIEGRVVCLSRLHPDKLLHRLVETIGLLRGDGMEVGLAIAGPVSAPAAATYARSLTEKIDRLGLSGAVELMGEIVGDAEKSAFLSTASVLVNLSVTNEESFGKSPVEALGLGVPVLASQWDGFPEVIGQGGALVPVVDTPYGMDIRAEDIAGRLRSLLQAPPPSTLCREEAARSAPARVAALYRQMALEAEEEAATDQGHPPAPRRRAAPVDGLLARTAPLDSLSQDELYALHDADLPAARARLRGAPIAGPTEFDRLRSVVLSATKAAVSQVLAGRPKPDLIQSTMKMSIPVEDGEEPRLFLMGAVGSGTIRSRLACLQEALGRGAVAASRAMLADPSFEKAPGVAMRYLEAEAARLDEDFALALDLCCRAEPDGSADEAAAFQLQQLAQVAREAMIPTAALPRLAAWLEAFPDGPDAATIWVEFCLTSLADDGSGPSLALQALRRAKRLLPPSADLERLEAHLGTLVDG